MSSRSLTSAALSGALTACAYPIFGDGWGLAPLVTVALVPLLLALRAATPREGAALGALFGGVFGLMAFTWIVPATELHFHRGVAFAVGAWLAHAGTLALAWGALGWGLTRCLRAGVSPLLAAPAALMAFESFAPRVFPGPLSAALYLHPEWLQLADLVGVVGVSGGLAALNAALAEAWRGPQRARALALALGLVIGARGYGALRLAQVDADMAAAPTLSVGVAQPGASDALSPQIAAARLRRLQESSIALSEAGAELILWPESSYRVSSLSRAAAGFQPQSAALLGSAAPEADVPQVGFNTPLLFNAPSADPARPEQRFNTAWLLDDAGRVSLRYDKARMVPFAEYNPAEALRAQLEGRAPEGLQRGQRLGLGELALAGGRRVRLGVLICYEAIRPEFAAALGLHRPELLAVVANDAHFGSAAERELHFALLLPRAIEQRRALARAGLNGVSALVDPAGRLLAVERGDGAATLLAELPLVTTQAAAPLLAGPLGFAALLLCLVGVGRSVEGAGPR